MRQIRRFQDLTIGDNYMFGAVMMENDNCRQLLERVLEMPISRVEVIKEKSMIYHPECKGVRLDVYAKDEKNTHYDVEMQLLKRDALPKRSRYYHSQMDMELLASGAKYEMLPNTYVIFICDFDPFSDEKYRYCFQNICRETGKELGDGAETIFENIDETRATVNDHMDEIIAVSKETLAANGFTYGASAELTHTDFPEKTYGDYTFPEGNYEALEITLGDGAGHNWWCVLYPNMCFRGSVYEVVEDEAKENLKEVLTPDEYESIFDSGKYEIKLKILDIFR